jgi:hypothetical protein
MSSMLRAAKSLLIFAGAAAVFVVTVQAQSPGVAPRRSQPFHRNTEGLGSPEDRLGRSGSDRHLADCTRPQLVRSCPACRWTGRPRWGSLQQHRLHQRHRRAIPNNNPLFKTEAVYTAEVERALGIRKTETPPRRRSATGNFGAPRCRVASRIRRFRNGRRR